jgi:hypothetical protein
MYLFFTVAAGNYSCERAVISVSMNTPEPSGRTLTYAEMVRAIQESTPSPKGRLTPDPRVY